MRTFEWKVGAVMAALLLLLAGPVWGQAASGAKEGPTTDIGLSQEKFEFSGGEYWGNGITLGLGYQFLYGKVGVIPMYHINLMKNEKAGLTGPAELETTQTFLEVRRYGEGWYAGARGGFYVFHGHDEKGCNCISLSRGRLMFQANGPGAGLAVGWVFSNNNMLSLEYDQARMEYWEIDVNGNKTPMGYGSYFRGGLMYKKIF